jgi:hypothetical protein
MWTLGWKGLLSMATMAVLGKAEIIYAGVNSGEYYA